MTATTAWRPAKESVDMASEREIIFLARLESVVPLTRAGPLFKLPVFKDALLHNSLPELGVIGPDLFVASAPPGMGFADRMDDGGHFPHLSVGGFGKQCQASDVL